MAVSNLKEKVLINETIQPGEHWDKVLSLGQVLKITDVCGQQGVDFLCYNAQNPKERYHAPNTMKAARNIRISKGSVLYSDYARPLMTVVEDTTKGGHDTIAGCCSAWSNELLYGAPNVPGCRENFLSALAKHDLGWQDIVPNINFFCSVPVYEDGHTEDSVFVNGRTVAGDYVELQAETEVLAIISNCPQVNNPCNSGNPTEIRVQVYER